MALTMIKQLLKMNECRKLCIIETHCAYDKVYKGHRDDFIKPRTKVLLNINNFSVCLFGIRAL